MSRLMVLGLLLLTVVPLSLSAKSKAESLNESDYQSIVLQNGKSYKGKLLEVNESSVTVEVKGKELKLERGVVKYISFGNTLPYVGFNHIKKVKDKELKTIWRLSKRFGTNRIGWTPVYDRVAYDISDEGELKVSRIYAIKITTAKGLPAAIQEHDYWNKAEELKLSYALTIQSDGSMISTADQKIKDDSLYPEHRLYNNRRRLKVVFNKAKAGALLVYRIEKVIKGGALEGNLFDNHMLLSTQFTTNLIVEVKTPEGFDFSPYIYRGELRGDIRPKKPFIKQKVKDGVSRYTIKATNIDDYYHRDLYRKGNDHTLPQLIISTGNSWEEINRAYWSSYFSDPIPAAVKIFAEKLTAKGQSRSQQLEQLYNYINHKIDHIDIAAFYPTAGAEKLIKANSLTTIDKSYLFVTLCRAIGIDANLTFFRSGSLKPIIEELPSLKQLDSTIVNLPGSSPRYFSFSSPLLGAGQFEEIMGDSAKGLTISQRGEGLKPIEGLKTMEAKSSYRNSIKLLADNSMIIDNRRVIEGYSELSFRELRFKSPLMLERKLRERAGAEFGRSAELLEYSFINDLSNLSSPIELTEKIRISEATIAQNNGLRLFKLPSLALPNHKANSFLGKIKRDYALYQDRAVEYNYSCQIELPSHYKVNYLPKTEEFGKEGSYSFTYIAEEQEGVIRIKVNYRRESASSPAKEYMDFRKWYLKTQEKANQWIIIEETK